VLAATSGACSALDGCGRRPGRARPSTHVDGGGRGLPGPRRMLTAAAGACSALDGCRRWRTRPARPSTRVGPLSVVASLALDGCRRRRGLFRPRAFDGCRPRRWPPRRGLLGPSRLSAAAGACSALRGCRRRPGPASSYSVSLPVFLTSSCMQRPASAGSLARCQLPPGSIFPVHGHGDRE
jgi:hypothetical protein